MCVFAYLYVSVMHAFSDQGDQMRVLEPLELDLQEVVIHHVGTGN